MIRILLADDHDIMRRGLRNLLETHPGWEVCGEAANGREAVKLARELKPDIVVLDLSMPELNGLEATRQIRKELPQTEVLIFTMHDTEQLVREVLAAGARGYVLKSDAGRYLISGIEAVAQHKPFFTSTVAETILDGYLKVGSGQGVPVSAVNPLTPREREIVQLLAEGRTNKEVASALSISVKTVETHRRAIMSKLGIGSIVELVHFAIRNKLVTP
jgi:DNA-binding NarL/FixJ family response regulator